MARNLKNKEVKERNKKEGLFRKIARKFVESSQKAQKATVILFILILLSIITGIVGYFLVDPAKEIYVAETTFIKESRNIYDYQPESEERNKQIQKADESEKIYASVMDKYSSNENAMISWYAKLHSNFIKVCIAILVLLPFASIGIMFIGSPKNFLFAVLNIAIVVPILFIVYLFNSFRNEDKEKKVSKREKPRMLEAAE